MTILISFSNGTWSTTFPAHFNRDCHSDIERTAHSLICRASFENSYMSSIASEVGLEGNRFAATLAETCLNDSWNCQEVGSKWHSETFQGTLGTVHCTSCSSIIDPWMIVTRFLFFLMEHQWYFRCHWKQAMPNPSHCINEATILSPGLLLACEFS